MTTITEKAQSPFTGVPEPDYCGRALPVCGEHYFGGVAVREFLPIDNSTECRTLLDHCLDLAFHTLWWSNREANEEIVKRWLYTYFHAQEMAYRAHDDDGIGAAATRKTSDQYWEDRARYHAEYVVENARITREQNADNKVVWRVWRREDLS